MDVQCELWLTFLTTRVIQPGLRSWHFQARLALMPRRPFSEVVAAVFAANPELAEEFYISASELLNDFEHWGPVIQANEHGEYDDSTEIVKLRTAYEALSAKINALALEDSRSGN